MSRVTYPDSFSQRVIALEAPGDVPEKVNLVIPTISQIGRSFPVKIALMDSIGYPSLQMAGSVTVSHPQSSEKWQVVFQEGKPAIATIDDVVLKESGFYRFKLDLQGRTFYSNPTKCSERVEQNIYWGDPHVHSALSGCCIQYSRSLPFCFIAGRLITCLDWVAAADHVSNGRCDHAKWKEQVAVSNAFNDPPDFVTLPAYEASFQGGSGGDNNVYMSRFPEMFVDDYEEGNVRTLCEKLQTEQGLESAKFFVVPHHTSRVGKHGEINRDIYPGEELMPAVEIHSKWGASEYHGNPNPLRDVHPGPSCARDLLNQGLRLGFVGGTDAHATIPAGFGEDAAHIDRLPAMTAVFAETLSRQNVFDSIKQRACYAASLEKVYLNGSIAGKNFGQSSKWNSLTQAREITASVAAQSNILKVELVRNGSTIYTLAPENWHTDFNYTDNEDIDAAALTSETGEKFVYYYLRITCESGAQAWSSPVWLCLP